MFIIKQNSRFYSVFEVKDAYKDKQIEIYRKDDCFYIKLNSGYVFDTGEKILKVEYRTYVVECENNYYTTEYSIYENNDGYVDYGFYKRNDFILTNNDKASIISTDINLKKSYLMIKNNELYFNHHTFVNGIKADENQIIKSGDHIFFQGVNIYVFRDFYYINSFRIHNRIPGYMIMPRHISYRHKKEIPLVHLSKNIDEISIENPKEYVKPKIEKREINTIWPSIVMVLSISFISAISFYNSYLNDQPLLNRLSFIVMPIAMSISTVMFPLLFYLLNEHKNRKILNKSVNDYLIYLDEYEKDCFTKIDRYISLSDELYFHPLGCEGMMFQSGRRDRYFLNLSLGHQSISFPIEYKKTEIEKIDRRLLNIEQKLARVDGYPLFLDVRKYSNITVLSKAEDRRYFILKFLLELSYKHHYDDLLIGVYGCDDLIGNLIYNLPHLYVSSSRMIFVNVKQLESFENVKTDRFKVLLMCENTDYYSTDKDIHCIHFIEDLRSLIKDNDVLVEYNDKTSYLRDEGTKKFVFIKEEADYASYFRYLGKLKKFELKNNGISFSDFFDVWKIGEYYHKHDSHLKAYFAFNDQEKLCLDLHETGHGPHGLIGGSTGSGKSELIISLLLSLCVYYPPDYLNIVLIDYKGSGIYDSLSYEGNGLPHIIGSVSNLDNSVLKRLIISLNSELRSRQKMFNELSVATNKPIVNLDDYLESDYESYGFEKKAHIVIVVDEFAELKKTYPETISDLISVSRIGRSLGIHLILATQRPSGAIDEDIWSNSRFKIALKMFDEKDSKDIIKTSDAAYLEGPGSFILKSDDGLAKYQSIYAKADEVGHEAYSVGLFDNMLNKTEEIRQFKVEGKKQNEIFCKKILDVCSRNKYSIKKLDFLPPVEIYRSASGIRDKFVAGISDDYINCVKKPVEFYLDESILIYSSNRKRMNSYLNTLNECKRKTVIIAGRYYHNSVISVCLLYHENDDVMFMLNRIIEEDLDICLVIEDVYSMLSYNEQYLELLIKLMKQIADKKTNVLCFTSNSSVNYRLLNSFKQRLLIGISERNSILDFYSMKSEYIASSYYYDNEPIGFVPVKEEEFEFSMEKTESLLKKIPESIKTETDNEMILLGYDLKKREKVFGHNKLQILSLKENLLKPYKEYENVNACLYSYKTPDADGDLLWLGQGLFKQHIFISGFKDDLNDNEGLYIRNGSFTKIRILDHE